MTLTKEAVLVFVVSLAAFCGAAGVREAVPLAQESGRQVDTNLPFSELLVVKPTQLIALLFMVLFGGGTGGLGGLGAIAGRQNWGGNQEQLRELNKNLKWTATYALGAYTKNYECLQRMMCTDPSRAEVYVNSTRLMNNAVDRLYRMTKMEFLSKCARLFRELLKKVEMVSQGDCSTLQRSNGDCLFSD